MPRNECKNVFLDLWRSRHGKIEKSCASIFSFSNFHKGEIPNLGLFSGIFRQHRQTARQFFHVCQRSQIFLFKPDFNSMKILEKICSRFFIAQFVRDFHNIAQRFRVVNSCSLLLFLKNSHHFSLKQFLLYLHEIKRIKYKLKLSCATLWVRISFFFRQPLLLRGGG